MKKIFTLFVYVAAHICLAQEFQLVNHLSYHSEQEERVFSTTINDFFAQALAASDEVSETDVTEFKEKLTAFYQEVDQAGLLSSNKTKSLNALFDAVHDAFLEVYRREVGINELKDGVYNCVTASCLYVEILDHYSIPYSIIECPNHVYLIAYPRTEFIVFETTSPFFKNFQYSKKEQKQLKNQYVKSKMVRESDVAENGFLPVYFIVNPGHQEVERRELLSFVYGNRYSHEYDIFDKQLNQEQLDKAMVLSALGLYSEIFTEQVIYNNFQKDPQDSVELLKFLMAANINKNRNAEVADAFDERFNDYRNDYDLAAIEITFSTIESHLKDKELVDEIRNSYLYHKAICHAMFDQMDQAVETAKELHQLNPEKEKAKELLIEFLMEMVNQYAYNHEISAAVALKKLEELKVEYPFLNESDDYLSTYFKFLLEETEVAFGNYKLENGEAWMERVLAFQKQYGDHLSYDSYRMEIIYAYWADCYANKSSRRSMEIINQGLNLYPRSERLLERKGLKDY